MTPALTDNRQRHVARSSQDSFDLDFETLQGMLDQELQVGFSSRLLLEA